MHPTYVCGRVEQQNTALAAALIEFDNGALGSFFISDSAVSPWTSEGSARHRNSRSAERAAIA